MQPHYAIIVAAGSGSRAGTSLPKQFELIGGKPTLLWSIEAFYKSNPHIKIILVLPKNFIDYWKNSNPDLDYEIVAGGEQRFHSVQNGLSLIKEEGLVAVHDAARPFISSNLIKSLFDNAQQKGSAIPIIGVKDSLRKNGISVDRSEYSAIQTPQVFKTEWIKDAYSKLSFNPSFTDCATLVEKAGHPINFCEGEEINFKITTSTDVEFASFLINRK